MATRVVVVSQVSQRSPLGDYKSSRTASKDSLRRTVFGRHSFSSFRKVGGRERSLRCFLGNGATPFASRHLRESAIQAAATLSRSSSSSSSSNSSIINHHNDKYRHSTHRRPLKKLRLAPSKPCKTTNVVTTTTACASAAAASGSTSSDNNGGAEVVADLPEDRLRQFQVRRLFVFLGILLGYSCYYLTRNSMTYTAPVLIASDTGKALGLDITSIGALTSIFPIAYGMSKFVSGVVGAKFPPRVMLAGGLALTGVFNILFGYSTSMAYYLIFWTANGVLQGFGGPACARVLTSWFATKERGTYWGMWNIAHNLGGFLAPLLAGNAARIYGWQWGMWAPGIVGVVMAVFVLYLVGDSPEAMGYPPVEKAPKKEKKAAQEGEEKKPEKKLESEMSLTEILFKNVLSRPAIWGMAFAYFFVYVLRQGITSWSTFYLLNAKGVADVGSAVARVSGLELGGLAGSLVAGKISDYAISRAKPGEGSVGKRVQVVMAYLVGVAGALLLFKAVPGPWAVAQWFVVFMIGFFLYGPQMLIGLCGAELVGPLSVGASEGFLGWIAYLGAANAGVPLSIIVKNYGWNAYFITLLCAAAGAMLLLAPMVNLKSAVQREAEEK
ncbi:MFS domain-containing protein [Pseudoscourfieldia marina]